jgi:preprotein translocase subunit SecY
MLTSVLAAFRVPDLKKRILFVFAMFAVYVIGLHVPLPMSGEAYEKLRQTGGLLDLLNAFTGGAFKKFTIFAMGITPYINASIIMQLLTMAVPQLEQLAKEGEPGQKKIRLWTRWMTGGLAFFQGIGMTVYLSQVGVDFTLFTRIQAVITLTAGTAFLMWLGEQITDRGIGNGVSLIIFAGIVASLPSQFVMVGKKLSAGTIQWYNVVFLVIAFVLTVMAIVAVTQAQRKIPIQHVKRVVGNKVYGGQSSFLPLKINSAGVIPIIFAISLQYFPGTIAQIFFRNQTTGPGLWANKISQMLTPGPSGSMIGTLFYAGLVIFFTYFYTAVTFNVPEVADNLKKWGSFIPGIRPGKPTMEYLDRVMTRITLAGALFLAAIALAQYYVPIWTGVGANTFSLLGGTSLLIVVGVALETMQAIESQLLMRHYEGFIK